MSRITIKVARPGCDASSIEVEADVIGGLAVHVTHNITTMHGEDVYSITHVVTGKKVSELVFTERESACGAARVLASLCVDWAQERPFADVPADRKSAVAAAVNGIAALYGGWIPEFAIDDIPAGRA